MALFGPKATPIPPFADGRGPVDEALANELGTFGWSVDSEEVLSKRFPVQGIEGTVKLFFGTWNASQYGVYTQIGRATSDGKVPYPYTRVKVLPYGFTNFGILLTLVRLFDVDVKPSASEADSVAQKMSTNMWDIRNQAQNYGPIT